MPDFLPVASPSLTGNERAYVNECLDSTWISAFGEFVGRFEDDFASFCGVKHAVSCSNGTVALHLALLSLGIGPGDEVLVPTLTYIATANAVRYCGAEPVFVDCDINTWNIDPGDLERKISARTRAVIPVHLYGKPAPMGEVTRVARAHALYVIEDAAEAHGAQYEGQSVGSFGAISTFSFFANKIITCGEGGMVVTNDDALAERVRMLKGQGQDPQRRYWFPVIGYNYRMTSIQAAIGLGQLEQIGAFLRMRDEIRDWYDAALADVPGITFQGQSDHERAVCWLYSVVLSGYAPGTRDAVMAALLDRGIETRPFFYPVHTLPPYSGAPGGASCRGSLWLAERGISLPTWIGMEQHHVTRVVDALAEVLAGGAGTPDASRDDSARDTTNPGGNTVNLPVATGEGWTPHDG